MANETAKLIAAYPQLFTTDMARWRRFYTSRLGFSEVFFAGEPAFYGQVRRGDAVLNIRHIDTMAIDAGQREREVLLAAYIEAMDIAALFAEYNAAQVEFQERLVTKPWGRQEFVVRDPDGNLLCFGNA
jgi:catechol 2,3-dioxygenase-like lactoylglutathione lyase family enzyme